MPARSTFLSKKTSRQLSSPALALEAPVAAALVKRRRPVRFRPRALCRLEDTMANRKIFASLRGKQVPAADLVNEAGGGAYAGGA
jgi:hypothetical protein